MRDLNEKINIFSDSIGKKIQQTGEYLAPKMEELKEKTKTKIQQTSEYLAPKAEELKEKTKTKIQQTSEYLAPKAEELKEKTKTKIQQTSEYLAPKMEELKEKAKTKIQQTSEYLVPKAAELKEKAKAKIQQTSENLAQKTDELKENTKAKIQQTSENLAQKTDELKEKTKTKVQQTGEYLAPKAEELKEKAKVTANKFTKHIIPIVCLLLLLFCILLFLGVFSNSKDLYVISIGVPTYKNHYEMDAEQNQYDAEKISKILKRAEGLFSNVYYGTIAEHGLANNSNVEKIMNKVYKKAGKNDVVLIYVSSHGKKYKNGEYLLLFYDFNEAEIYKTGFKAKNLIKKSKIKTIVWIDACESGAAAKDLINNNVDLLVSSGENECSYSDRRGSAFTNALLDGLDCEADDDRNGIVSLQEITRYVVREVRGQNALNPIKKFSDVDLVKCRD